MNSIIEKYGYTDFFKDQVKQLNIYKEDLIPGRITSVHKEQYNVVSEYGESSAKLKGSLFYNEKKNNVYPTVGDFVLMKHNPLGESVIYIVLERRSKFSRLDTFNNVEQILAANFDYVFIIFSLNNDFNVKRVERYLTAAWQSGGEPIIILTKRDLCDEYSSLKEKIQEIAPSVPIICVSSFSGEGLEELWTYIAPKKTVVFLGSSGVGKSTLLNVLYGEELMKVNSIRENDSKGRHTTTHRQLVKLKNESMIIDTPGMREIGMWEVSEGLEIVFEYINILSKSCRFKDCKHEREPGCAVKVALESGELSKERWDNYNKLKKESIFAESKENIKVRQENKAKWKNISKLQKESKRRYK